MDNAGNRIIALAEQAFEDVELAVAWLTSPKRALHGATPLEASYTAEGAARIERQLRSLIEEAGSPGDTRDRTREAGADTPAVKTRFQR